MLGYEKSADGADPCAQRMTFSKTNVNIKIILLIIFCLTLFVYLIKFTQYNWIVAKQFRLIALSLYVTSGFDYRRKIVHDSLENNNACLSILFNGALKCDIMLCYCRNFLIKTNFIDELKVYGFPFHLVFRFGVTLGKIFNYAILVFTPKSPRIYICGMHIKLYKLEFSFTLKQNFFSSKTFSCGLCVLGLRLVEINSAKDPTNN